MVWHSHLLKNFPQFVVIHIVKEFRVVSEAEVDVFLQFSCFFYDPLDVSKVMLKILQARLQQYVNCKVPDVQAGFRKGRGTKDQIANIHWIIEKAREFQKSIYFCFIYMPKPLTVWTATNSGKFLKNLE